MPVTLGMTLLGAAVNFASAVARGRAHLSATALRPFLPHKTLPSPPPLCGGVPCLDRPLPGCRLFLNPPAAAQWCPMRWHPHRPPPPYPPPPWCSFPPPPMEIFHGPLKPRGPPLQAPLACNECGGPPVAALTPSTADGGRPQSPKSPLILSWAAWRTHYPSFFGARGEPGFWRGRRRWQSRQWGQIPPRVGGAHGGAGAFAPRGGGDRCHGHCLRQPGRGRLPLQNEHLADEMQAIHASKETILTSPLANHFLSMPRGKWRNKYTLIILMT